MIILAVRTRCVFKHSYKVVLNPTPFSPFSKFPTLRMGAQSDFQKLRPWLQFSKIRFMPLQKKKKKKRKKIHECWPSKSLIVFHRRAKGTAHLQEEFLRFDEILPKGKKERALKIMMCEGYKRNINKRYKPFPSKQQTNEHQREK